MPTTTPSPLLLALRQGTRDCHKMLEARLPFFSPSFDSADYRRLLQAYYGFHFPLEHCLSDYQGRERHKAPTLARDLLALGLSEADVGALPLCQALPAIHDEASALGVMYVLEGSTLGGQVLKRAMAERLGIGHDSGAAFLDVYGERTGEASWSGLAGHRLQNRPLPCRPPSTPLPASKRGWTIAVSCNSDCRLP